MIEQPVLDLENLFYPGLLALLLRLTWVSSYLLNLLVIGWKALLPATSTSIGIPRPFFLLPSPVPRIPLTTFWAEAIPTELISKRMLTHAD